MVFFMRRSLFVNFVVVCLYVGMGRLFGILLLVVGLVLFFIWVLLGFMVVFVLIFGYYVWIGGFWGNVVINFWYLYVYKVKNYLFFIFVGVVFLSFEFVLCGWLFNYLLKWKNGCVILFF